MFFDSVVVSQELCSQVDASLEGLNAMAESNYAMNSLDSMEQKKSIVEDAQPCILTFLTLRNMSKISLTS